MRKAIIRRSYLEKKYLKKPISILEPTKAEKCARLYQKERKHFFNGLNPSFVTDNELFWEAVNR